MRAKLTIFAVFGTAAYLGIAVLGWGGWTAFSSHPPLVLLVIITFVLAALSGFTEGNLSKGIREDRSNRWVLAAFGVIGLLSAYLPAYTDRHDLWTIDGEITRWVGLAVYAIGGALRLWPVFVLGRRFSGLVAIQPEHTLVTTGAYRAIRNPSYLGLLIGALGWGLVFRSWVGVVLALLNLIPLIARIRSEEELLRAHFGAEYEAYRARTWRLIPGIY
jgi:protein-S-isoprenylcysteine O-methyltransferase Ste14